VGYLVDEGDSEKCAQNIHETLAQHPDLACFVGMAARNGPILLRELKEEDKLGQIKLITFDDAPETLDGVEAGHIYATVVQDPYRYGYEAVSTLASLCRHPEVGLPVVGKGFFFVTVEPIRQDNVDEFRDRLKAREQATEKTAAGADA
jgi:ribose transport system substrate-binding protein